jgi:ligand-binding sensor domain-containing protein
MWINTSEFGIYQLETDLTTIKYHELTDDKIRSIVDDERQYIYEDSQRHLWIALHGNGLAHFNAGKNEFEFYRNSAGDNSSISSDNVYCITEDHSGLLWVGTGPANGGVNKVYTSTETFRQFLLETNVVSGNENVVRSLLVDDQQNIWIGTKSGEIYIMDDQYQIIRKFAQIPLVNGISPGQNAYTMIQDSNGFIWIGTKGGGIFVTQLSTRDPNFDYRTIRFHHYTHDPGR